MKKELQVSGTVIPPNITAPKMNVMENSFGVIPMPAMTFFNRSTNGGSECGGLTAVVVPRDDARAAFVGQIRVDFEAAGIGLSIFDYDEGCAYGPPGRAAKASASAPAQSIPYPRSTACTRLCSSRFSLGFKSKPWGKAICFWQSAIRVLSLTPVLSDSWEKSP